MVEGFHAGRVASQLLTFPPPCSLAAEVMISGGMQVLMPASTHVPRVFQHIARVEVALMVDLLLRRFWCGVGQCGIRLQDG